jgi:hypothetical protein
LLASLPIIVWETVISSGEAIWANVAGILWCGGATKSLIPILQSALWILCIKELILFDEFLAWHEITTFCIGHKVITSTDPVRASDAGVLKCRWATITLNLLTQIASCGPLFDKFKIVDVFLASDILPVICCNWNNAITGCRPIWAYDAGILRCSGAAKWLDRVLGLSARLRPSSDSSSRIIN